MCFSVSGDKAAAFIEIKGVEYGDTGYFKIFFYFIFYEMKTMLYVDNLSQLMNNLQSCLSWPPCF